MANVFVIGAGPAGLFAAQKLALAGHQIVIFNRDVKPGGLAEYGIYPLKDKMKDGLRKQFAKVLDLPNVHYLGHVPVGANSQVSIQALRELSPAAMIFAVGAQGTKKLGLPGEEARGVYSAKDFVYHYNQLPPFATHDFSLGKCVAIIGMGNVMVDIARWLLRDDPEHRVEEVIVVARRGPLEAKFDEKEFRNIQMHLDRHAFQDELKRVKARMAAVGQGTARVPEETFPCLLKFPEQETVRPRLNFRFLSSPFAIVPGPDGRIARIRVAENILVNRNGSVAAESSDKTTELDVDTMIFAIGDVHESSLGLPFNSTGYVTNPDTIDPRARYEIFDPEKGSVTQGMYVLGWARKASEGLVGIARHDGESGATYVLEYLDRLKEQRTAPLNEIVRFLEQQRIQIVPKCDLPWLRLAEQREASSRNLVSYKFPEDAAMLSGIEHEKSNPNPPPAAPSSVAANQTRGPCQTTA